MSAILRLKTCLLALCLHCNFQSHAIYIGAEAPSLGAMRIINPEAFAEAPFIGLKGKITIIDFWATWCGPCVESIPHWNQLAEKFKPQGVQFLAITDENEALVRRFLKRTPIQSWVGIEGPGPSLRHLYGISGIPATVIINKQGIVAAVTHPIRLRPEHIEEVIATGTSSIRPLEKIVPDLGPAADPPAPKNEAKTEPVTTNSERPILELSARRSGPREPGRGFNMWSGKPDKTEIIGEHATVEAALVNFFNLRKPQLDLRTKLPVEDYDFQVRLPISSPADRDALFTAFFKTTFGLQISRTNAQRDVWIATRLTTNSPALSAPVPGGVGGGGNAPGRIDLRRGKIAWTLGYFEEWLGQPVIDQTGDTNTYDIHLRWDISKAELALYEADPAVVRLLFTPDAPAEQNLTPDQQHILRAMRGKLSRDEMASLPADKREEYALIAQEMAKPEEDRFKPTRETILAIAPDQLGIELKPAQRPTDVLIVTAED